MINNINILILIASILIVVMALFAVHRSSKRKGDTIINLSCENESLRANTETLVGSTVYFLQNYERKDAQRLQGTIIDKVHDEDGALYVVDVKGARGLYTISPYEIINYIPKYYSERKADLDKECETW